MRGADFSVHDFIGFTKQRAPFAVAEDDVMNKQIAQQRGADLAGERAIAFPMHVLRADLDILRFVLQQLGDFREAVNGGMITISTSRMSPTSSRNDSINRVDSPERHVHLPVRRYDFLSHKIF